MTVRITCFGLAALILGLTSGCASIGPAGETPLETPRIPAFSANAPGEALPTGWEPWTLSGLKKETAYEVVDYMGRSVVRAAADQSASGLIYKVRFDPKAYPLLTWRWKVPDLIETADNTRPGTEDSPVRVIVAFDGDASRLPPMERIAFTQFRMLTGKSMPFATLMYIWENNAPRDTIISNVHTRRVKMVVADSGTEHVGQWREQTRNIYDDYVRAFGVPPPPVKWIGIMSDTDNTRSSVKAYYGDIELTRVGARKP